MIVYSRILSLLVQRGGQKRRETDQFRLLLLHYLDYALRRDIRTQIDDLESITLPAFDELLLSDIPKLPHQVVRVPDPALKLALAKALK